MSLQDPIADCLTRMRNGLMRGKKVVHAPFSKFKHELVSLLVKEGYVDAAADQIRERDTREGLLDDSGDLLPRLSHGAAGFVFASRRAERAVGQGQRAFECADHLRDGHRIRLTREAVATLGAALGDQETFFGEDLQDFADHWDWKLGTGRELSRILRRPARVARKLGHQHDSVVCRFAEFEHLVSARLPRSEGASSSTNLILRRRDYIGPNRYCKYRTLSVLYAHKGPIYGLFRHSEPSPQGYLKHAPQRTKQAALVRPVKGDQC